MGAKLHHHIETEQPVVGFERDGWTRYLTLHGERAFIIGGSCDTCAFMFERRNSSRLSPTVVSERLAAGTDTLGDDLLAAVGALLPTGDYAVSDLTIQPALTRPCDPTDYFSHESVDLFGMPDFLDVPNNPRTPYWRAASLTLPSGSRTWPAGAGTRHGPINPRRFYHFIIPMEPPRNSSTGVASITTGARSSPAVDRWRSASPFSMSAPRRSRPATSTATRHTRTPSTGVLRPTCSMGTTRSKLQVRPTAPLAC